jgi:hypothetical protein
MKLQSEAGVAAPQKLWDELIEIDKKLQGFNN